MSQLSSSLLTEGRPFPQFSLPNQDKKTVQLADLAGKWFVLYVYPKDDTPGCTLEGRGFSKAKPEFDKVDVSVFGLSQDDVASHKDFCDKFSFTIPLLADTRAELLKALGVGQDEYKGKMYWNRVTFIVDPKGVIRKVYPAVKPEGHEAEVLADLKRLMHG
ncbi:MAG: peroxiredoxin [Oligoflexia bacterium]|nr:peroxiredoxin [Oligoflexia bacterium]